MKEGSRTRYFFSSILLCICLAPVLSGCAHRYVPDALPNELTDEHLLEATCEENLSYLGSIIEDRLAVKKSPTYQLLEAQEIFRLAQTLYLQKEYSLAIELIENAIEILEKPEN